MMIVFQWLFRHRLELASSVIVRKERSALLAFAADQVSETLPRSPQLCDPSFCQPWTLFSRASSRAVMAFCLQFEPGGVYLFENFRKVGAVLSSGLSPARAAVNVWVAIFVRPDRVGFFGRSTETFTTNREVVPVNQDFFS